MKITKTNGSINVNKNVVPQQQPDDAITYKLCLVGDTKVGKSSLLARFARNQFHLKESPTLGMEFQTKVTQIIVNGDDEKQQKDTITGTHNSSKKLVRLQVWDIPGAHKDDNTIHHSIKSSYYRSVLGILLVYDITNHRSFDNLEYWLKDINKHIHSTNKSHEDIVMMLVGNKVDLNQNNNQREVTTDEAISFSEKHNLAFIETSALDHNQLHIIEYAFQRMAVEIYNRQKRLQDNFGFHNHHGQSSSTSAIIATATLDDGLSGDGPFDDIDINAYSYDNKMKGRKESKDGNQHFAELSTKKKEGPTAPARVGDHGGWLTCFNCFLHRMVAPTPDSHGPRNDEYGKNPIQPQPS